VTEPTPATSPEVLAAGYARCAEITREHGTTYYWGARLLPAASRRHVHAVYTLARLADDIVDLAGPEPGPETAAELDAFEASFWQALADGTYTDPVMAAVATSVRECGIADECFTRFFGAMRSDLTQRTYETWADLLAYMDGSAAVIGEMMLPVLNPRADAVVPARALGLAFQLTNFLRDVGEDLDRGRVYIPQEDLRRFGADPHARVVTPQWRELMAFQIERNRRLYREADAGIPILPGASRRCVATARVLYARILEGIEAADYDVFTSRARVPTARKAALAARMVTSRDPMRLVARDRAAVDPFGGAWVSDDPVVLVDEGGAPIGQGRKSAIHHDDTPLHLAFSCYVLDPAGRLLVTTRAASKPSFPGVVTNTVCGHPTPGEDLAQAVRRRARSELGVEVGDLRLVLPEFRYRAQMNGIVENEVCPVFVGWATNDSTAPDPEEVDDVQWVPWEQFRDEVLEGVRTVSPWATEQVPLLAALGPDPRSWPAGSRAALPPAATLGPGGDALAPAS
jgi:isopentenyl-diphosphate delta-isomerase type 1